jgi:RHS repeat-associated protein
MFSPRHVSSLLAFCFSLFMSFTTASAVDLDPATHQAVPGDFNGDGRLDALMQPLFETGEGGILLQDGTGNLSVLAQGWNPGYLGLDWSVDKSVVTAADLNGDGLDDVVVQPHTAGHSASVLITDPTIQLLNIAQVIPADYLGLDWSSAGHLIVPGDFDGDHQKELLLQTVSAGGPSAIVHADQAGHLVAITQSIPDGYLGRRWDASDVTLYVGDLNGDGRQDLLMQVKAGDQKAGESAYALLLADENGRFTQISQVWNTNDLGADWSPATHTLSLQDLNGTGVMSIVLTAKDSGGTNYVFDASAQGTISKPTAKWTGPSTAHDVMAKQRASNTGISVVVTPGVAAKAQQLSAAATTNSPAGMTMSLVTGNGPVNPNAFGTMGGQSGAEGGSASYSTPIAVPPGIAGTQPSLSLNYSSQGGNGEAGFGWSLSGASAIHRCPATYAQDGYNSGVTYGKSNQGVTRDRLCLDGQHLIAVSGIYGQTNSVYRTERDSMVRVTLTGSIDTTGATFEVDYQDGRKSVYGGSGATFTASGAPASLVWAIQQTYDPAGNNVVYDYQSFGNGEYHLGDIKYTGSTNSSGTIASTGNREVDFTYSQRADPNSTYLAGGRTDQTQVLTQITTKAGGIEVLQYSLNYSPSLATGRSLLRSVQECGPLTSDPNSPYCLPADTFSWQEPVLSYNQPAQILVPGPATSSGISSLDDTAGSTSFLSLTGDFNGDGRNELFYDDADGYIFSTDGSWAIDLDAVFSGPNYLSVSEDFMRNGLAEMLGATPQDSNGNSYLEIALCNPGASCTSPTDFGTPINTGIKDYSNIWVTGDFTGDGLPDVITKDTSNPTSPAIYLYPNTTTASSGSVPLFGAGINLAPLQAMNNCLYSVYQQFSELGDMDGNGIPDLLITGDPLITGDCNPTGTPAAIAFIQDLPGTGPTANVVRLSALGITRNLQNLNYYFADINGDGLKDFVFVAAGSTGQLTWHYQLNQGGTFAAEVDTGVTAGYISTAGFNTPFGEVKVGDFTGEGKDEFLVPVSLYSTYCENIKVMSEGVWQPEFVCGQGVTHDHNIYQFQIVKFVEQTNGTYTAITVTNNGTPVSLEAEAGLTTVGDLYGTGIADVYVLFSVWYEDARFNDSVEASCPNGHGGTNAPCAAAPAPGYYAIVPQGDAQHPNGLAPDLMTGAVNGLGAQAAWTYDSLADLMGTGGYSVDSRANGNPCSTSSSTLNTGGTLEYYCFASSMWAVSSYSVSNGISGINTYTYAYKDAVYEDEGRGFQGFKSITVNDLAAGTQTVNTYNQNFPLSGMLVESKVSQAGTNPVLLSDTTESWQAASPTACVVSSKVFWSQLKKSIAIKYNTDSSTISTTTTTYGYDGYGNTETVSASTTDAVGAYTDDIINTPESTQDCTDWWTDELQQKTVTSTVTYNSMPVTPSAASITRTANYSYNTTLRKVQLEQDDLGSAFEKDTAYAFDTFGNPKTATITSGSSVPAQGAGALANNTDYAIQSRVTQTIYNADGYFLSKTINALNQTTTFNSWDNASGQPTSVTDPNGVGTTYTYDTFGRKNSEQVAGMSLAQYTYAAIDSECPSNDAYSFFIYQPGYATKITCNDILGRVNLTITAGFQYGDDIYQATMYDALGRVHKSSEPYLNSDYSQTSPPYCNQSPHYCTVYAYDVLNRVTDKVDAKGVDAAYTYGVNGNPLETQIVVTPPDSPTYTTYETHSSLGKMLSTIDANSSKTDFRYDAGGNPVMIQDAASNQTTATFNILGQKTAITDPDMGSWTYAYDVLGELLQQTDAKSQQITMTYDPLGRMSSKVQPEGTTTWTYDSCTKGIGKLCNVTQYDGYSETDGYDQNGRLTSTDENIKTIDYITSTTYDADGRVSTVTYPATIADAAPAITSATASQTTVLVNAPPVTLTGAATDADTTTTTPLQYLWTMASTTCGCNVTLANATTPVAQFTPAMPGIYTFQFLATDGLRSTTSTVTVNVQPQAPGATSTNETYSYNGAFSVNWSAATGSSSYNPTYNLYQSINGGAYTKLACGTCAQLTQAFTGMGSQTSNITYTYKVTASAGGVEGPASSTTSIPVYYPDSEPSPNTLPSQSNWDRSFTVSWGASTGMSPSYTVQLGKDVGTGNIQWTGGQCTTTALSCKLTPTANGTYYAKVESCNQLTCNAYVQAPGEVSVTLLTPPAAPGLSVVTSSDGVHYTVSWNTPATATSFNLYYSYATKTGSFSAWSEVYSGSATSYTTKSGIPSYYLRYYAVACNQGGCGGASGTLEFENPQEPGTGSQIIINSPTSPTPAPNPVTTAAPAPASSASTSSAQPATTGPTAMVSEPTTGTLLAVEPMAPLPAPKAPIATTRTFDYAPPVYKAYADAHLEAVTNTSTLVGVTVSYSYNNDGYLSAIINNANPNQVYWVATGMNARDQVTDEQYGVNGTAATVTSHRDYYPESGYVENIQSTNSSAVSLQNLHYDWQELGNLADRHDLRQNVSETFGYDTLNRVTSAQVTNGNGVQPSVGYTYDALGNITTKSDVSASAYVYGGVTNAGPHAVTSIPGIGSYSYDPNGNMTSRNGTTIGWNSDNLPTSIVQDTNNTSAFNYTPDKHRVYQTAMVNGLPETTVYAGGLEVVTDSSGNLTHNRYQLSAYGRTVAIVDLETASNAPVINEQFVLSDHLGSMDVATDATGAVVGGTGWNFEAFGKRRDAGSWQGPANNTQTMSDRTNGMSNGIASGVTHRGHTGHEMLDNVGLVHANGRVYDPLLGRFLSVDPVFQFPTNTQSLNPYSYVLNNPLSATDPSGYTENCTAGQTTGCPPAGSGNSSDSQQTTTTHVSYTPTGSHIAISGNVTSTTQANGNQAATADNKPLSDALSAGAKSFAGGNGEQNSQQGAGSIIATGKSQAGGTAPSTATQAASVSSATGHLNINTENAPPDFANEVNESINYTDKSGVDPYSQILSQGVDLKIAYTSGDDNFQVSTTDDGRIVATINYNPNQGIRVDGAHGKIQSPALGLLHEGGHIVRVLSGVAEIRNGAPTQHEEDEVIRQFETPAAKVLGEPTRQYHWQGGQTGEQPTVSDPTYHDPP